MSVSKYNLQSKEKHAKNVCLPYSAVKTHEFLFWYEKVWIWLVQCPTVGQGIIFCVCLVVHTKISKPQTSLMPSSFLPLAEKQSDEQS